MESGMLPGAIRTSRTNRPSRSKSRCGPQTVLEGAPSRSCTTVSLRTRLASYQARLSHMPSAMRSAVSRTGPSSVRESQHDLRVVVQDLVDVLGRQDRLAQIEEVLAIALEREQDGIVAAGHQVISAERLPGAGERGLRAVADDVVEEAACRHARALRQVRMLLRRLVVEALQQHRDDPAEVRDHVLDVREALRDAPGDQ